MLHIIPSFWYFSLPWEDFITLSLCDELFILLYTRLKCLRMWFTRFPVIDTIKIEPAYNYDYRNVQGFIVVSRRFICNAYHNISFCRVWSFQTLRYSCTLIYEIRYRSWKIVMKKYANAVKLMDNAIKLKMQISLQIS